MVEWVYVDTATKRTINRGNRKKPFENYAVGVEPNLPQKFGPAHATLFLPVTRETPPAFNPVTESLVESSTMALDDSRPWEGAFDAAYPTNPYVHGDWVVSYTIVSADLAAAKTAKIAELDADYITAKDAGTVAGGFRFRQGELRSIPDLIERVEFLTHIVGRYAAGEASDWSPPTKTIYYKDSDGLAADSNTNAMQNRFGAWFNGLNDIEEVYRNAEVAINAAANIAAVDAVTWTFP